MSDLNFKKQIMNPYPTGSPSYTAWEKGFIEGWEELEKEVERLKGENEKLWEALIRNMPKEKLELIKNALNNL